MRTYSASAIVLKRIDLGEKDRILTLYTRERGKVSAVAKGARRPGSKLSGATEPLTYARYLLDRGRDLDVISQAEIRESFPRAKSEMKSVAYGVYMLELVHSFVDDSDPDQELFDTLLSAMYVLESGADPELVARYFELHLLDHLGYKPHYDCCVRCAGEKFEPQSAFSPALGGMVCGECGTIPADVVWVSRSVASYVKALEECEPHKLGLLKFPSGARKDLAKMLKWHISYRLERRLKSTKFIDAVARLEGAG